METDEAPHNMVFHMKTTLNIDDSVMQHLREEAGLRRVLAAPGAAGEQRKALPPLPTWRSGGFRVDIANRDALYRMMEEE